MDNYKKDSKKPPIYEFQLLIIGTSKWELAMVVCIWYLFNYYKYECLSLITQIKLKYLASPISRCHPFIDNPLFPICLCKSIVNVQSTYQSTCLCKSVVNVQSTYQSTCLCKSFVNVQSTYQSTCICFSYTKFWMMGYNVRCKFWVE